MNYRCSVHPKTGVEVKEGERIITVFSHITIDIKSVSE